jgi:U3 small nucleolar RNA-associated protein 12
VQFVPRTHYFFSVSKDGYLKYWDADHYEHVLSLPGHQSEIWAMCVSSQGDFVVTGSHDRSIRVGFFFVLFLLFLNL